MLEIPMNFLADLTWWKVGKGEEGRVWPDYWACKLSWGWEREREREREMNFLVDMTWWERGKEEEGRLLPDYYDCKLRCEREREGGREEESCTGQWALRCEFLCFTPSLFGSNLVTCI